MDEELLASAQVRTEGEGAAGTSNEHCEVKLQAVGQRGRKLLISLEGY
jgi:hypothetical protein